MNKGASPANTTGHAAGQLATHGQTDTPNAQTRDSKAGPIACKCHCAAKNCKDKKCVCKGLDGDACQTGCAQTQKTVAPKGGEAVKKH
jgi:hypothetical protein